MTWIDDFVTAATIKRCHYSFGGVDPPLRGEGCEDVIGRLAPEKAAYAGESALAVTAFTADDIFFSGKAQEKAAAFEFVMSKGHKVAEIFVSFGSFSADTSRHLGGFGHRFIITCCDVFGIDKINRKDESDDFANAGFLKNEKKRDTLFSAFEGPSTQADTAARQPELQAPAVSQIDNTVGQLAGAEGGGTA